MSNGFPCVVFNGEVDPDAVSINFWSDASALVAGGSMSDIVGSVYLFVVASGGGASLLLDRTGDGTYGRFKGILLLAQSSIPWLVVQRATTTRGFIAGNDPPEQCPEKHLLRNWDSFFFK